MIDLHTNNASFYEWKNPTPVIESSDNNMKNGVEPIFGDGRN